MAKLVGWHDVLPLQPAPADSIRPNFIVTGLRQNDASRGATGDLIGTGAVEGDAMVEVDLVSGLLLSRIEGPNGIRWGIGPGKVGPRSRATMQIARHLTQTLIGGRFGILSSASIGPSPMHDDRTIPESFLGSWRIKEVGEHLRKEIDLAGRATITYNKDGGGSLRFFGIKVDIDCRCSVRSGDTFIEFTWPDTRDGSPVSGRGWATVLKTGGMMGHLWVRRQGDANFTAIRHGPKLQAKGRA